MDNMALRIAAAFMRKTADYPKHPDDVVVSKGEAIAPMSQDIKEIDIYNYYTGAKSELLKELKNRNLFIVVKPKGVLKAGQKPIYIRHPYHGNTEYIRISNPKDFEVYHSGRTVEYHVTMPQMAPYYIVDFDAPGKFSQTTRITADIADAMEKIAEVKKVEVRYTGKRGFHIIGWLKKPKDVNDARNFLKGWLKETFRDRDDIVMGESPKGEKGALGLSPMKLNGGHVAKWSMRVSGFCCIEVPRSKLVSFKREDASIDKTYKKITGKSFVFGKSTAQKVVKAFMTKTALPWLGLIHKEKGSIDPFFEFLDIASRKKVIHDLKLGYSIKVPSHSSNKTENEFKLNDIHPDDQCRLLQIKNTHAPEEGFSPLPYSWIFTKEPTRKLLKYDEKEHKLEWINLPED